MARRWSSPPRRSGCLSTGRRADMGCHHEISNGRGVTTVIDAGGAAAGCSFCKEEALKAENAQLAKDAETLQTMLFHAIAAIDGLVGRVDRLPIGTADLVEYAR